MRSFGSRNNWGVGHEREVDTWVWHKIGLELRKIDVEGAIEAERGGDGGDNYGALSVSLKSLTVVIAYPGQSSG
jgi:hypothetical protein